MLRWPARCVTASGMGREGWSRSAYSYAEECCTWDQSGFHNVAEIIMQLVSGRGRGNAAFRTSASSFLDLEAQSGVELGFFDGSRASHCGERPAGVPLSPSQ